MVERLLRQSPAVGGARHPLALADAQQEEHEAERRGGRRRAGRPLSLDPPQEGAI